MAGEALVFANNGGISPIFSLIWANAQREARSTALTMMGLMNPTIAVGLALKFKADMLRKPAKKERSLVGTRSLMGRT